jgi:ABC-type amino acid transport/signal transduction systems, periplasmic component/domain
MKIKLSTKLFNLILIAVLAIALTGCGTSQATSNSSQKSKVITITAVTDGNVAPFAVKNNDGSLSGYDADVLKAIVKKLPQYQLQWKITNFDAILGTIDSGRGDVGVNHFGKTPQREEKYVFSEPIFEDKPVFIVKKDNNTIKSFATAAGKTTPAQVGTGFSLDLEQYNAKNPNNKIKLAYSNEVHDLQDVNSGKYDFAYTDLSMYNAEQKQYHFKNVKAVPLKTGSDGKNITHPYTYFIFAKTPKAEKFQKAVNSELEKLAKDGTLTKISKKYLGSDFSPAVLRK